MSLEGVVEDYEMMIPWFVILSSLPSTYDLYYLHPHMKNRLGSHTILVSKPLFLGYIEIPPSLRQT